MGPAPLTRFSHRRRLLKWVDKRIEGCELSLLDHLDLSGLYHFVVGLHLSREAVAAVGWAWLRKIALFNVKVRLQLCTKQSLHAHDHQHLVTLHRGPVERTGVSGPQGLELHRGMVRSLSRRSRKRLMGRG